ncbi:hypothetical protein QBC47DRAFT_383072 [Echria macrotheca]|uniref:PCI domain-containing protein n=1 Tax=Echria macrotheca TaxID=438768 RepID=A0AAJ0BBF8_9PEZI|nr:hypothetical protein QBC47DRAFT_383072 [Echria macrotheca]
MEQTKALMALEPFLALSKSAASPRAAADLIQRATSAPNTFIFTELLETPQIQALASSPEYSSSLTLLRIFSYGTYANLKDVPSLPTLNDAQKLKLRQLSLLSLVRDAKVSSSDKAQTPVLSYPSLLSHLDLATPRELEDLVISTIYAGLIHAQLDPKHALVRINNVAALRDVAPGGTDSNSNAIGGLLSSLQAFAGRCEATLHHLEEQMSGLRAEADRRAARAAAWSERLEKLVEDEQKGGHAPATSSAAPPSGSSASRAPSTVKGQSVLTLASSASSSFAKTLANLDNTGSGSRSGDSGSGSGIAGTGPKSGSGPGSGSGSGSAASAAARGTTGVEGLMRGLRHGSKRGSGHMDASSGSEDDDEAMDVDEDDGDAGEGGKKRSTRKKLQ